MGLPITVPGRTKDVRDDGMADTHSSTDGPLRDPGSILLISCYELGHRPCGITFPLAFLEESGFAPATMDISVDPFDPAKIKRARLIGISVPMHTALRLGVRVAERAREINPNVTICMYGLYAALNADYLLDNGIDYCIGGEVETPLVNLAIHLNRKSNGNGDTDTGNIDGVIQKNVPAKPYLQRLPFVAPRHGALPPLEKYARLEHLGQSRVVGYTEASRGCLHLCTHCPIPPVYHGRFFIVPEETVLDAIRGQVDGGATHITFGDPDFLNGPTHSLRVVRRMHEEFPQLTFDFTAKVQHILEKREIFPELGQLGCLFMISAVESLSDGVLNILEKHHTRADVEESVGIVRDAGITFRPTWVAFTPWTTLDDYLEVLEFVEANDLIDHVDPVQYAIRLLVPPGSYLLDRPAMQEHLGSLDQASFSYRWTHPDDRMDVLHREVGALVEADSSSNADPADTFYRVWSLAAQKADRSPPLLKKLPPHRIRAPRLSEPWFC